MHHTLSGRGVCVCVCVCVCAVCVCVFVCVCVYARVRTSWVGGPICVCFGSRTEGSLDRLSRGRRPEESRAMAHRTRCCIFTILNLKCCSVMADAHVPCTATLCNTCATTHDSRDSIRYADEHSKAGGGHLVFGWISTGKRVQHSAQQSLDVIISQSVHLAQQAQSSARRIQPLDAPFAKAAWCVDRSRSIFRSA